MLPRELLRARKNVASSAEFPGPGGVGKKARQCQTPRAQTPRVPLVPLSLNPTSNGLNTTPSLTPLSLSSAQPSASVSTSFASPSTPGAMNETVRVAVRCRPPNPAQGEREDDVIVSMDPARKEIYLLDQESHPWRVDTPLWSCQGRAKDGSPFVTQAGLYELIGRPLLLHALDGYNSTLMAYGQTGSGKTYTMMGSGGNRGTDNVDEGADLGLIPRMCRDLFFELDNRSFTANSGETLSWEVHVRYVEVYCERVSDLLNSGAQVSVREVVAENTATFALVGACRVKIENTDELLQVLELGNRCRRTAATKTNERSSRSHAIFMIELTEMLSFTEPDGAVVSAPSKSLTIRLVDLAGSERVSDTGVQGVQLKEAKDINLSLFTLGMVIEALTDTKRRGIKPPYRDSILTKLLRDAFGGNSKTTMICTISPTEACRLQSIQTLNYAAKARRVLNKPRVEEDPSALELRRANEELLTLRRQLAEAQRDSLQYATIEGELEAARERLRQEQQEARRRKSEMERREAEVATRLRDIELQRDEFEQQMAALAAEAERAKALQQAREEELKRAKRDSEAMTEEHMRQLQEHQATSQQALEEMEERIRASQRAAEDQIREVEAQSRQRIEELVQQRKTMEEELHEKERFASAQERELRKRQKLAEEEARRLEQQTHDLEAEWKAQTEALEAAARQREQEATQRAQEAQARLRAAEEAAERKEAEMRAQWNEADLRARRVQAEMDAKQAELDRRVAELNRQIQERESELSERALKAEMELHQLERQSQQQLAELASLKETVAHQSETARNKERSFEEHQSMISDAMRIREENLKKREAELNAHFEEALKAQRTREAQRAEKELNREREYNDTVELLKVRERALDKRDRELREQEEDANMALRTREMDLKRVELELLSQKNDVEALLQREQQENLRVKEELQHQLERAEAESKLYEKRLQRWEEDLRERRLAFEKTQKEREMVLQQREAGLVAEEDRVAAKSAEVHQLMSKAQETERERQLRLEVEEAERLHLYAERLASLDIREIQLNQRHRSMDSVEEAMRARQEASVHQIQDAEYASRAFKTLHRREILSFVTQESIYRDSIAAEEEIEFRFLQKDYRLERRDRARCVELLDQSERLQKLQVQVDWMTQERLSALAKAKAYQEETATLQTALGEREQELVDLRVRCGTALSAAKCAEETVLRLRTQVSELEDAHQTSLQAVQQQLSQERAEVEAHVHRYTQLASFTQQLVTSFEEEQRHLLEHHASCDVAVLKRLEVSERQSRQKNEALERWQCLYQQRNVEAESEARRSWQEEEAKHLAALTRKEEELKLQEEGLVAESAALQRRIDDFEARERTWEAFRVETDERVRAYLMELQEMDRTKKAELDERERALIELAMQLEAKKATLSSHVRNACESLLSQVAEYQSDACAVAEELQRDHAQRMEELTHLHKLAESGDVNAVKAFLERKEESLRATTARLAARIKRAKETEAQWRSRVALHEDSIRQYLLALQEDDVKRAALSEQGQAQLREAEARLAKATQKEEALRDLARRLNVEALAAEERSRETETSLRREESRLRRRMKQRKGELDRRQQEVSSAAEDNERTLLALETNLEKLISGNKHAEEMIRAREAELERQAKYGKDLAALLAERERQLREEHAHRMRGKDSATSLVAGLLQTNTALEKEVRNWKRKLSVLYDSDVLECEHCGFGNRRPFTTCRACHNTALLPVEDSTSP